MIVILIATPTNVVKMQLQMAHTVTSLFFLFVGTNAASNLPKYKCYVCDNEAGKVENGCDEQHLNKNDKAVCLGETCSVTSYVRHTYRGCQSSC